MPRSGESIAPCLGYAATITLFTVKRGKVVDEVDVPLENSETLDRVRLMRDQQVGTLICGGIEQSLADLLEASGVRVISWVSGRVDDLLDRFMRGELVSASPQLGASPYKPEKHQSRGPLKP
jgi:predicted Fe-Mo cluster-binding NifX family protein